MRHTLSNSVPFSGKAFVRLAPSIFLVFSSICTVATTSAQQRGQRTFATEQEAAGALFDAMQAPDERGLMDILGPAGKDVISSGDQVEDLDTRLDFVEKYKQTHRFATEQNGSVTVVAGAENWPLPIPLVKGHDGSWYFDTAAGKNMILFRRISKNELAAKEACSELVDAQKKYFAHQPDGTPKQFAQKLVSDEGQHNGLYWEGAYNQFDSPISPLIAYATGDSPNNRTREAVPFNGYLFRVLTSQGVHGNGGARSYVVGGKLTGGFAFVAYPAGYGSSGVNTFIVGQDGVIFEKDLGANTTKLAQAMTSYDPDSSWHKTE